MRTEQVKNPAPAKAVEQQTNTIILPANTRITPELIKHIDRILEFTNGGAGLWQAYNSLLWEFITSGRKPKYFTVETSEDSYFLQELLIGMKYKSRQD